MEESQPAAHPIANLRLYEIEVETEIEGISGSAAAGFLTTLLPKRPIDSARGSFLGKGRPVGSVSRGSQSPDGSLRTPFACHPNGVGLADGN